MASKIAAHLICMMGGKSPYAAYTSALALALSMHRRRRRWSAASSRRLCPCVRCVKQCGAQICAGVVKCGSLKAGGRH